MSRLGILMETGVRTFPCRPTPAWIIRLENNPEKTWQKVLADFSESPENQSNVADLIANGIPFDPWVG